MADTPEVKVKLTAEDTGVAAAIKELGSQLKNLKSQQDDLASSGLNLTRVFSGVAAAASLIGLARIGKEAFDSAVNIGKMADKTGISTQTLSVFHKVADDVGASTEAVDKGLIKAARSITQFEQGGGRAAQAFGILNLRQKDFANLKPDEKIALVTDRIGKMQAGFQKATATQLIFGKGSGDLTIVLNSLAAQGFDAATESTKRLGLLLDQSTTDSFREAKAAMQELEDVGKGMATQFEAGLLPAITDVGEGLIDAIEEGGGSFQDLGKDAGQVIRAISFGLGSIGISAGHVAQEVVEFFDYAFEHTKSFAKTVFAAVGGYIRDGIGGAVTDVSTRISTDPALKEFADRVTAVEQDNANAQQRLYENLFPSDEEEEKRRKARLSRLRVPKEDETKPGAVDLAPKDAAARAELALLEKQLQDELAIHRAYATQTAAIDKEAYDKGEITLKQYFDRRRAEVAEDAKEEIALLQQGKAAAQAEANKAALDKTKASTPQQADRDEATKLQALAKVDELQTKITETEINAKTKTNALDAEQFKATEENQQKIREFHKLIAQTQQNESAAAKEEIAIEAQKLAIILAQAGESKAQIDAEIAKYTQLKTAQASFTDEQKVGEDALKSLADQRSAIEDKVKSGQLFQLQGEAQIRDLEQSRLPVLQQIAAEMLAQAQATGDQQKIQAAQDFQKQVNDIGVQSNQVGQQIATIKQGLQSSLTGGIEQFFGSLLEGTRSVGQAFRGLAASVVGSLAKMTTQMVAQIIVTKLLKTALGGFGFSGGGQVPDVLGTGFAEGGLVRGPGRPKADAIPARLSHGEFVVNADAVKGFGAANLEAINRGLKIPSIEQLSLPKFAEGGLVGSASGSGSSSDIRLGIGLDEGLILKHLSSKAAGNIILQHLANNPKAAGKALSRSQ